MYIYMDRCMSDIWMSLNLDTAYAYSDRQTYENIRSRCGRSFSENYVFGGLGESLSSQRKFFTSSSDTDLRRADRTHEPSGHFLDFLVPVLDSGKTIRLPSSGDRLTKAYDVTIQKYRSSYAKIQYSKMHILRCMGSKFCVKFQRCPSF